jgi:hypothetical protein
VTREQKAAAAIGSVLVVGIFLMFAWSLWIGSLLLAVGVAAVVGFLRATHPRGASRPSAASKFGKDLSLFH